MSAINTSSFVKTSNDFIQSFKSLLEQFETSIGKQTKIRIALEIFEKINNELPLFLAVETQRRWIKFVCTIFSKTTEFKKDYRLGIWHEVDEKLVDKFIKQLDCTRNMASNFIQNYTGPSCSLTIETKKKIKQLEAKRTLRNIKRVNYTGMDTIEPESEYDGITNIWADLSRNNDSDYEFEEDEDDDKEPKSKWSKKQSELSTKEKVELKQYLTKLVDNHRVKRNVARVNYAGMDMSEDDIGTIHIAKRWFENGKVKYIWKKYSLSQANEIGDEDYVDEEVDLDEEGS